MALTTDQLHTLRTQLEEQRVRLQKVLESLEQGDPKNDLTRLDDNADVLTDAIEDSELVSYESLERETQILLDRTTAALHAMDEGTYGVTAEGQEIPYERLLVDPTATTVVS